MRWNASVLGRYVTPVRGSNVGVWNLITAGLLQKANLWSTQSPVSYTGSTDFTIPAQYNIGDITAVYSGGFLTLGGNLTSLGLISLSCVNGQSGGTAGMRQNGPTTITAAAITLLGSFGSLSNTSQYALSLDTSAYAGTITLDVYNGAGGYTYNAYSSLNANAGVGTINWTGGQAAKYPNTGYPITLTGAINLGISATLYVSMLNATATSQITGALAIPATMTCNVFQNVTMTISGSITNASGLTGAITKTGNGTLVITGASAANSTYTGTTTISAGTIQITKNFSGLNLVGTFTPSSITVNFGGTTPTSGSTYRFFPGSTTMGASPSVTLTNAGGATATYNQSNSTLTIN